MKNKFSSKASSYKQQAKSLKPKSISSYIRPRQDKNGKSDLLDQTIELCRSYNIKPARSKGQNFLINEIIYDQIIAAADIKKDDVVLEVGPGLGFLTAKLSKVAKKVISVELDDKLAGLLKTALISQEIENVEVINGDIMKLEAYSLKLIASESKTIDARNIESYKLQVISYKIVANLPYNITSVFLRKFLESENHPGSMVLMLQKEVAERIVAQPPNMSILAVSVQFYANASIICKVPALAFWPVPEVESAIVKFKVESEKYKVKDEKLFFRLVRFGFSAKRKMLKNNLAAGFHIGQKEAEEKIIRSGLNGKIRAQELSLSDWINIFGNFQEFML